MTRNASLKKQNVIVEEDLTRYFNDLKRYKPLPRAEERQLMLRYKEENDIVARQKLITHNLRYAFSLVNKYKDRGVSMADLIEEANKGLIQSIDKFDVNQDVKVITYAKWQMECNMKKAVKEKENLKEEEFPEGVMVNLNEDALNDNEYVGAYENDAFSNETEVERQNAIEDVNNIISILNEREADFIKMYYGINPYDKEYTYQEIGKKYNLTKERVRQVIDKIMRKLRVQALTILEQ